MRNYPGLRWYLGLPVLFLLDQISKWAVLRWLPLDQPFSVMPGVQFIFSRNYGVAFSLLEKQAAFQQTALISIIVIICIFFAIWLAKTSLSEKKTGVALVLILGGALGNLSDRIRHGYVIDFIDFHIGGWHWYTFNLADTFITIGALMMLYSTLFTKEEK